MYRTICDIFEEDDRLSEAIGCFQQMQGELTANASIQNERDEREMSEWLCGGVRRVRLSV